MNRTVTCMNCPTVEKTGHIKAPEFRGIDNWLIIMGKENVQITSFFELHYSNMDCRLIAVKVK